MEEELILEIIKIMKSVLPEHLYYLVDLTTNKDFRTCKGFTISTDMGLLRKHYPYFFYPQNMYPRFIRFENHPVLYELFWACRNNLTTLKDKRCRIVIGTFAIKQYFILDGETAWSILKYCEKENSLNDWDIIRKIFLKEEWS